MMMGEFMAVAGAQENKRTRDLLKIKRKILTAHDGIKRIQTAFSKNSLGNTCGEIDHGGVVHHRRISEHVIDLTRRPERFGRLFCNFPEPPLGQSLDSRIKGPHCSGPAAL